MRTFVRTHALLAFVLMHAKTLYAQLPLGSAFTYQGHLTDAGQPENGSYDLRFALFGVPSGGSPSAGPICADNVNVVDGLFTVPLDFGAGAFDGDARWLEIAVRADSTPGNCAGGAYTTLTPRQPLSATPYALQTRGIFVNAAGSFVGIGRDTPLAGGTGEVLGLYRNVSGFGGMYVQTNAGGAPYYGYSAGGDVDAYHYFDDSTGHWRLFLNGEVMSVSRATGNLGVGTLNPTARLHIASNSVNAGDNTAHFSAGGIGPNDSHIHFGTAGDWYIRSAASTGKVVLQDTGGNVGIGTSAPAARLHVAGSGTVLNAANRLFVTPTFVGVGRQSTVSVAEHFGVQAPVSSGFGGMYVQTDGPAGQPFYGYSTGGAATAWSYLDGADGNVWKLDNGGVRMTVTRAGRVGIGGDYAPAFAWLYVDVPDEMAIWGISNDPAGEVGVFGSSTGDQGVGVQGEGDGFGVYSLDDLGAVGTKSFNIDHPADPQNKYLKHYCHEGAEPQNVYNGLATLDEHGEAEVALPSYFAAINKDPRYTLTAIGAPMPMLHIAREVDPTALAAGAAIEPGQPIPTCCFRIAGGAPRAKVSWELKATRNDRWVQQRGAPVEIDKPARERGKYQRPKLYGQPPEMGASYRPARQPITAASSASAASASRDTSPPAASDPPVHR